MSALSLGVVLVGCDVGYFWRMPTCDLIGCTSGPQINLPTLVLEGFHATVETDVADGSFECDGNAVADAGSTSSTPSNLTGDFTGSNPALLVSCTSEGFWLAQNRGTPPPRRVSVDAEGASSGTVVTEVFEDIEYEVTQPNGPDCEPTCHDAVLTAPAE